jgi:hypothetical protein
MLGRSRLDPANVTMAGGALSLALPAGTLAARAAATLVDQVSAG